MSSPSDAAPSSLVLTPVRPFYWSIRREIWESRSIYIAPLSAAGVVLFGFLLSTFRLPDRIVAAAALDPSEQGEALSQPYSIAAVAVILTGLLVAVFYCLGALYGERRDRSILFWKSLPVSDLTTVIAKATIPLVVLPVVVFFVILVTQLIILQLSTAILLLYGGGAAMLWTEIPWLQKTLMLLYALIAFSLWYAPIYGWLLLVSAWAKRAPFLWAVLPPLALCLVEKIAFGTSHAFAMIAYRLKGGYTEAFNHADDAGDQLSQLDPIKFLGSSGLWLGLAVTIAFLAAAVWLRRYRQPI